MALVLPVLAGICLAALAGGRLSLLGALRFHGAALVFLAIGIQVVAFPSGTLPWQTPEQLSKALWLASYCFLLTATALNRRLPGVPLVGAGIVLNVVAIAANDGLMPATPEALTAAGLDYDLRNNSVAAAEPHLSWLVDRFAAPEWVPLANVFSVGDVAIAAGIFLLVVRSTLPRPPVVPKRPVGTSRTAI